MTTASSEKSGARIAERSAEAEILLQIAEPVAPRLGAPIVLEELRALARTPVTSPKRSSAVARAVSGSMPLGDVVADALLEMELQLVVHLGLRCGLEGELAVWMREGIAHGHLAQLER